MSSFFSVFCSRTHILRLRLCVSKTEIKGFYIPGLSDILYVVTSKPSDFNVSDLKLHPRAGQRVERKLKLMSKPAPWVGSHRLKLASPNLD